MLQSLEREPSSPLSGGKPAETTEKAEGDDSTGKRSNPHKYLLYRPTFAQLYLYIATSFKEISDSSAMLLYISADGAKNDFKGDSGLETGKT